MNIKLIILLFFISSLSLKAQNDWLPIFSHEYDLLYQSTFLSSSATEADKSAESFTASAKDPNSKYVNTAASHLMNIIFLCEMETEFNESISKKTRELISFMREPYLVVLLERAIKDDTTTVFFLGGAGNYMFKDKIVKEVSKQLNLLMTQKYPYYTYETKKKMPIKFFSVRTGNDLFCPFRQNFDRDYTGSLLIEVGTDYLNPLRRRPIKSYQTFLYGFDVFTPSFNDVTKFQKADDIDSLDRPHASFQYFGWSKKALSKYDKLRWSSTIKFGKIGGRAGEVFQNALHQDISYSLRPKGWDAQISKGGRLGISIEEKFEYQVTLSENDANINSMKIFNFVPQFEAKLGTYMTNASLGVGFSNKKFSQTNHNFINNRTRQGVYNFLDHVMYNASFKTTYVVHNTMLEGYGINNTTDQDTLKADKFTPKSVYVLQSDKVQRLVHTVNICVSYTTRFATFFYNWFAFSPETKLGRLDAKNEWSHHINMSTRWHHFAEIGLTFNIH